MIDTSAFVRTLEGKPVAVFGLGISNLAAIRALTRAGAACDAWDDSPARHGAAREAGARLKDFAAEGLEGYGCLVLAPGVPLTHPAPHPVVARARASGVEILCDIEILHRSGHGRKTIGITGTNGKSTTTALTGHVLNQCGIEAAIGGNIGTAALSLSLPGRDGALVLELSSYQIELCPTFRPDIGLLLNITPDHLDRHGTVGEYAAVKQRMLEGPGEALVGVDDELSRRIFTETAAAGTRQAYAVSVAREIENGVFVKDAHLFDALGHAPRNEFDLHIATLPGLHNHQNAAMAYGAARLMGIAPAAIAEAMKSFPGLPHRQFITRVINGLPYINDSKATNADATSKALACYRNIYWIAGGKPKDGGLDGLEPWLDRITHAFLIGEAMEDFAAWLEKRGVAVTKSGTLDSAVAAAHAMAQEARGEPGGAGTVLLSPACASFDQFKNFEERGERFAALVNNLPEGMA
jgi:UDP-N-acetylmuramoylalanine--D-glutamate ligase